MKNGRETAFFVRAGILPRGKARKPAPAAALCPPRCRERPAKRTRDPPTPYGAKVITRCGESGICGARAERPARRVQGATGAGNGRGYPLPSSPTAVALPSAVRASAVYFAKSRRAFSSAPGIDLKPASSGEAVMTNCCGTMVA